MSTHLARSSGVMGFGYACSINSRTFSGVNGTISNSSFSIDTERTTRRTQSMIKKSNWLGVMARGIVKWRRVNWVIYGQTRIDLTNRKQKENVYGSSAEEPRNRRSSYFAHSCNKIPLKVQELRHAIEPKIAPNR